MSLGAFDLIAMFEGLSLRPYICPAGVPTIGYGSTHYPDGRRVTMQDQPISREMAEDMLETEIIFVRDSISKALPPSVKPTQDQTVALISWVFNLGISRFKASTMRKRIVEGNWNAAADECERWVFAAGRKLPGLVARRAIEASMMRAHA